MLRRIALALVCTLGLIFCLPVVAQETPVVRFTVERFVVAGDNPLGRNESMAILTPFTGDHQGLAGLQSAADSLQRAIVAAGFPFYTVVLPPQRLTDRIVTLQVVAVAVGRVTVKGNENFSEANILASMPSLRPGEPPDTRALARSLRLANESPSKTLSVVFKESDAEPVVDATVTVDDSRPWQLFSSFTNTGTKSTGRWRASFGIQWSNLFDLDHALTLSHTHSPRHAGDVKQWNAFYRIPIYKLDGALSLFVTRSDVSVPNIPGFVAPFSATGAGDFMGMRYKQFLTGRGPWSHSITFGLDDKEFRNDLSLLGTQLSFNEVRSTPLSAHYALNYEDRELTASGYLEYARNMELGSLNNNQAYAAVRAGASASWDVLRFGGRASFPFTMPILEGWVANFAFDSQWSHETLIPGEQFGIGGAASVRGFDERELSADDGARLSAELYTPDLGHGLRALGFFDAGYVRESNPAPGALNREMITSFGIGVRWQWRENVSISADVANVVDESPLTQSGTKKVHLSLFARF